MAKTEDRIKEIRQQVWNKRKRKLKTFFIIIGVTIIFTGILNIERLLIALFWDMELFCVKQVNILPENAKSLLTGTLEIENPGNLLFLDTDDLHNKISKIREVEQCYITKEFPSTLNIKIVFRRPCVFLERNGGGILIDREGKMLTSSDNSSYLKVSGIEIDRDSVAEDDLWKLDILQEIERWYNLYNIYRYFRLEKITIKRPTEIVLDETGDARKIIITKDNIKETLKKIKIVLEECEKNNKKWEYIEGRFKDPVVKYKIS